MRRAEQFAEDIKFAVTLDEVIGLRDDLEALRALAGLAKSKRTSDLPKEMEESFMDDSTKISIEEARLTDIWSEVCLSHLQIKNYLTEAEKALRRLRALSTRIFKTSSDLRTLLGRTKSRKSRVSKKAQPKRTRSPSARKRKVSAGD